MEWKTQQTPLEQAKLPPWLSRRGGRLRLVADAMPQAGDGLEATARRSAPTLRHLRPTVFRPGPAQTTHRDLPKKRFFFLNSLSPGLKRVKKETARGAHLIDPNRRGVPACWRERARTESWKENSR